eukprot:353893-Chlamydomonas_euryale.AAC.16
MSFCVDVWVGQGRAGISKRVGEASARLQPTTRLCRLRWMKFVFVAPLALHTLLHHVLANDRLAWEWITQGVGSRRWVAGAAHELS